ncbi:MAG: ATP-binding cassette domain-containing protein, partial [Victivallales bacterium]|nr:ATP-binding cassette domain-containing protein [Victivallales bacterium]
PMIFAGMSQDDAREKAAKILTKVGLGERLFHRPFELSGGQQQRVAVARAIANDPVIILADEPTANLDVATGQEMIDLLRQLRDNDGVTVIAATHDMKMLDASDRILWIRDGKIDRLENRKDLNIQIGHIDGQHV